MDKSKSKIKNPKWIAPLALLTLLGVSSLPSLWAAWRTDSALTFAPLIPPITAILLWNRRDRLRNWNSAYWPGLILLAGSALLSVAANWADVEPLKPFSLIGILAGFVWYLGGPTAFRAASGAIGLLLLAIPWPETVSAQLQFPMQQISSRYAALLAGMIGLPAQREGVLLSLVPDGATLPVYRIVVSQQCSGLTSLTVLLTIGYLIAYHTPVSVGRRFVLLALTVPLALFANAVRLTIVLAAGMARGAALAQWVHDHEQPVLILLCSMGLMAIRSAMMAWAAGANEAKKNEADAAETVESDAADAKKGNVNGPVSFPAG